VASIFAWSGGLRHRGTLDGNAALVRFADDLEAAVRHTIEGGCVSYSDAKVAHRDIRVWHGATENGP
jgi:isocitrate dehydrogenase